MAQALAVASRVLRAKKPALADECLAAARKLWEYEQTHAPQYAPNAYVGRGGSFPSDEIAATAELWLTTDDPRVPEASLRALAADQSRARRNRSAR